MAIIESIIIQVATVDVNDEYRVELTQIKKVTDYTPAQARDLANELVNAADEAETALNIDLASRRARMESSAPALLNGSRPF